MCTCYMYLRASPLTTMQRTLQRAVPACSSRCNWVFIMALGRVGLCVIGCQITIACFSCPWNTLSRLTILEPFLLRTQPLQGFTPAWRVLELCNLILGIVISHTTSFFSFFFPPRRQAMTPNLMLIYGRFMQKRTLEYFLNNGVYNYQASGFYNLWKRLISGHSCLCCVLRPRRDVNRFWPDGIFIWEPSDSLGLNNS